MSSKTFFSRVAAVPVVVSAVAFSAFGGSAGAHETGARPRVIEARSTAVDRSNRMDQSGTAGRMGLGADPRYPEGPGNVVN